MVHTDKRGGEAIQKRFLVTTNDPISPRTELIVAGKVGSYITISPAFVRMAGPVGQKLAATVHIVPLPDYPFTITEVKAWKGEDIHTELKPRSSTPAKDGYELVVTNTNAEEGLYRDYIEIKTDLKEKPILNIPVNIRLFATGKSGPPKRTP